MGSRFGKIFTIGAFSLCAALAFAHDHHALNGTWALVPAESNFAGGPEIQNGTVTINDREGNIYVSRNFTYEAGGQIVSHEFGADGPVGSTVRQGKEWKTKARWDGDVLRCTTVQDGRTTVERFSLTPSGNLTVVVDREGREPLTLVFRRIG